MKPYYKNSTIKLYHGDCLGIMPRLDLKCDMCLTDPPYSVTAAKWDSIIPFGWMWHWLGKCVKRTGAICLFAQPPFSSRLISSNLKSYKYNWYWIKNAPTNFMHAKNRPMASVEEVCVFSRAPMGHVSRLGKRRMNYNPQGIREAGSAIVTDTLHGALYGARANQVGTEYTKMTGFHTHVLNYDTVPANRRLHITEKPVAMLEYLIRCYTDEGDTVLDFAAGSGSTGEACMNTGRKCIMIEKEESYCKKIVDRLSGRLI